MARMAGRIRERILHHRLFLGALAVWFLISCAYGAIDVAIHGWAGVVEHVLEETPFEHFVIALYLPVMAFVGLVSDARRRGIERLTDADRELTASNRQLATSLSVVQAIDLWDEVNAGERVAERERVRAGLAALAEGLGATGIALICEGVRSSEPLVVSEGVPADLVAGLAMGETATAAKAAGAVAIGPTAVVGVKVSGSPYGVVWAMRAPDASPFSEAEHGTLSAAGSYLAAALRAAELEHRREQLARTYEALFEQSVDAVMVTDVHGTVVRVSKAAEELTGYSRDELVGMNMGQLTAGMLRGRRLISDTKELEAAGKQQFDWKLRRADGSVITAEVKAHLLKESGGHLVQSIVRDVTAIRHAEEQKSEFVGIVSHEIGTPLTSVGGFARLLLERGCDLDESARTRALRHIQSQADRLARMSRDLLSVSRMDAGQTPFEATDDVDVGAVAERALDMVSVIAEGHRFDVSVHEGDPSIVANADALESVFVNLLSNAVKYSPGGGVIEIDVKPSESGVAVEVTDHGIGIASTDFERVFNRFMRLKEGQDTGASGVGLGLHIVRGLMQALGGTIEVRSRKDVGTTFRFVLPRRSPTKVTVS